MSRFTRREFLKIGANPDNDNHLRQALIGCNGKGVGTIDESEMDVHVWDFDLEEKVYLPLVMEED